MSYKTNLYLNYDTYRKSFITSLNSFNNRIRQEMVQFSLDLDINHIDMVYMLLFECYIPCIKDFKFKFLKMKE